MLCQTRLVNTLPTPFKMKNTVYNICLSSPASLKTAKFITMNTFKDLT